MLNTDDASDLDARATEVAFLDTSGSLLFDHISQVVPELSSKKRAALADEIAALVRPGDRDITVAVHRSARREHSADPVTPAPSVCTCTKRPRARQRRAHTRAAARAASADTDGEPPHALRPFIEAFDIARASMRGLATGMMRGLDAGTFAPV